MNSFELERRLLAAEEMLPYARCVAVNRGFHGDKPRGEPSLTQLWKQSHASIDKKRTAEVPKLKSLTMHTWIALFRGINVGGNNMLPMAKLKTGLESLKLTSVQTYIQSGNVVFQSSSGSSAALAKRIGDWVESEYGFRPQVLLLTGEQLRAAIERNPFPEACAEPKSLHFYFLAKPAMKADVAALDKVKAPSESYRLIDGVFYLKAPDGVGRSKLAAYAEKYLGVVTTARNYNTVAKLLSMISES